jgi:hypothetical protein
MKSHEVDLIIVNSNGVDDTAAIQAAAVSRQTIYLPDNVYRISGTVTLPDHVDIRGSGRNTTTLIQLPGFDPPRGMICCLNGGYNEISDIEFIGNGVSTIHDGVGAVSAWMDTNATTPMGPVGVYRCRLSGFQSDNWLRAQNLSQYPMAAFMVEDNELISVAGNSQFYDDRPGVIMASFIQAAGSPTDNNGSVARLVVRRNYFDGTGIAAMAIKSWENVLDSVIHDNEFSNVCQGITALINAYVIILYTRAGRINGGGSICNNKIFNKNTGAGYLGPGCGLYAASTGPIIANSNRIISILRSDNETLRRAALSFNGVKQVTAVGNEILGCATGIALSGYADQLTYGPDSAHLIAANNIYSDGGSSVGLNVSWLDAGTCAPKVALLRNLVKVTGTAVISNPGTYGSLTNDTI